MRDDTHRPRDGQDPSGPRRLRLVHPAPPPKPDKTPRTRNGRRVRHDYDLFTEEEQARLRAALKNARALFGSWACLADAMRAPVNAVENASQGRRRVSGAIAVRLARALGVPLESLYAAPRSAGKCPSCGRGGAS